MARKSAILAVWRGWVFSSSRRTAVASHEPSVVRTAFRALFSLFYPADCRLCAAPLEEVSRIPVCPDCLRRPQPFQAEFYCIGCRTPFLNQFPLDAEGKCALCRLGVRGFDDAYCFGQYEGALRDLIHLYKYAGVQTLAPPLAQYMAAALPRDLRFDGIAPVPLHWRRRWQRGFNQSELLARGLSRRTGLPVMQLLRRVRPTSVQAGLSNSSRRRNVDHAFRCAQPGAAKGKRILLVDDVMTTGSTGAACALALKQAGAARVTLLTAARVDRRLDVWQMSA